MTVLVPILSLFKQEALSDLPSQKALEGNIENKKSVSTTILL